MTNKILQSSYIELIKDSTVSHMYHTGSQKITKIAFRYGDSSIECFIFEFRNNKIYYGNNYSTSTANIELGAYIKEIYVEPVPNSTVFKNTKAIKLKLILQKNNELLQVEQTIFMRN
jgi:hypothetical protein